MDEPPSNSEQYQRIPRQIGNPSKPDQHIVGQNPIPLVNIKTVHGCSSAPNWRHRL